MFRLDQSPTYAWPVTVPIPMDGGAYVTETFDAHFRRVPQATLADLRKRTPPNESPNRSSPHPFRLLSAAHSQVRGWSARRLDADL